jgi:hypothetical protein
MKITTTEGTDNTEFYEEHRADAPELVLAEVKNVPKKEV